MNMFAWWGVRFAGLFDRNCAENATLVGAHGKGQ